MGSFLAICFEPCCLWILQEWRCRNLPLYWTFGVFLHRLPSFPLYSWSPLIPCVFLLLPLFYLSPLQLEALVWKARMKGALSPQSTQTKETWCASEGPDGKAGFFVALSTARIIRIVKIILMSVDFFLGRVNIWKQNITSLWNCSCNLKLLSQKLNSLFLSMPNPNKLPHLHPEVWLSSVEM